MGKYLFVAAISLSPVLVYWRYPVGVYRHTSADESITGSLACACVRVSDSRRGALDIAMMQDDGVEGFLRASGRKQRSGLVMIATPPAACLGKVIITRNRFVKPAFLRVNERHCLYISYETGASSDSLGMHAKVIAFP
jgi:hypothetical protein